MNKQPDTSMLAGKIAVMQAAQCGKRVERDLLACRNRWIETIHPNWDWASYDFRIYPNDLNPLPKGEWIPWGVGDSDQVIGLIVKRNGYESSRLMIVAMYDDFAVVGHDVHSYLELFNNFKKLDGSPCGKEVIKP